MARSSVASAVGEYNAVTQAQREKKNHDVKRLRRYFDEVWSELKKVSWPTREQVRNLTVLVFTISFVVGLYITVLDQIFQGLLQVVSPSA
jgi:preprotein translocase subunit SecE